MDKNFKMHKHRAEGSKIYSGRPLGMEVREQLGLDEIDKSDETCTISFPLDTVSINSSYFGGLFEKSVIELGREKFEEKYKFMYENGEDLSETLKENLEEGILDSLNEY